jgi:hypothetical protein
MVTYTGTPPNRRKPCEICGSKDKAPYKRLCEQCRPLAEEKIREANRVRSAQWQRDNPDKAKAHSQKYSLKMQAQRKANRPLCRECEDPIPYPADGRKTCSKECSRERGKRQAREGRKIAYARFEAYKLSLGCKKCGYKEFACALDFHHVDPFQKERRVTHANYESLLGSEERAKCVLLCANCHRVQHWEES